MKSSRKICWGITALVLALGCNLPNAISKVPVAQPGEAPSPAQGQDTQPSPAPKDQPAANDPTDFQGGLTARQGYEVAIQKALEWNANAVLSDITLYHESPSTNREGKSTSWVYSFVDRTLKTPEDRSQGYYVIAGEKGVVDAQPATLNVAEDILQADPTDWQIDSDRAVEICEQNGGADYRAANPGVVIDPSMMLYDVKTSTGLPGQTEKNVLWYISYRVQATGIAMGFMIDGTSGRLYGLDAPLVSSDRYPPVTARAGLDQALAKAKEWDAGAALISVGAEFPGDEPKTGPVEGLARFWRYEFIILPQPEKGDFMRSLWVRTSAKGIFSFREMVDSIGYQTFGDPADWQVDSDQVYRLAEDNGGKAFREQNDNVVFGMGLHLAFYPVNDVTGSKQVLWEVGYSVKNDYEKELTLYIDAASGEVVETRP